jgi:peptidoglycan hydrolase-like protein with peptidoglycan-binding domain
MQTTTSTFRSLSTLRRGSTSNDVRLLQQRLNAARTIPGISLPLLTVDGIFGARTEAAVRQFQTLLNLTVDGIVGSRTWATVVRLSLPDPLEIDETANVRPFRVEFTPNMNSAIVNNASVRGDVDVYAIAATAGQRLQVAVTSLEQSAVINAIITPENQQLDPGRDDVLRFRTTGDHLIVIGSTRGNANYRLQIQIR